MPLCFTKADTVIDTIYQLPYRFLCLESLVCQGIEKAEGANALCQIVNCNNKLNMDS